MNPFSKKPSVRIVGSSAFGEPATLEEVKAAFNPASAAAVRVMGQIALALREQAIGDAYASTQAELPAQAALHQGAGNAFAEFAQILADLSAGKAGDSIKAIFGE